MLIIRLQRTGKKNASSFRVVVAEKASHVSKKVHEILGMYNPGKKQFNLSNPERVQHWISQKIEISPTVHNLLVEKGVLKADKVKAFKMPKKAEVKEAAPSIPTEAPSEPQSEAKAE